MGKYDSSLTRSIEKIIVPDDVNKRWEKIPGVKGSKNPGIKLVLKNKFVSEDEQFLARIISGHPVWIKSE